MFSVVRDIYCPVCTPPFNRLECVETNYSGCGIDIGECENCKKTFEVSYKVDQVVEVK